MGGPTGREQHRVIGSWRARVIKKVHLMTRSEYVKLLTNAREQLQAQATDREQNRLSGYEIGKEIELLDTRIQRQLDVLESELVADGKPGVTTHFDSTAEAGVA